jgi:iron complex outermembrane receptor protein
MGGSVNVISRKPQKKFSGDFDLKYGTYNTIGGDITLSGRLNDSIEKGFYWSLFSHYLQSDGYITQSEADQAANPYIVKSNMMEWNNGAKVGYDFSPGNSLELDFIYFNDRQGTGEVVYQDEGNTTDHDTYHVRANYKGEKGLYAWNGSLFYLNEHYKRVNEFMKDDYTWYDVLSVRTDLGGLFTVSRTLGEAQKLTAGADIKQGGVDAQDVYYTSTDVVYNKGKMNTIGVFAQDEVSFLQDRIRLIGALRYDHARYFDGAFYIEDPSGETAFMDQYIDSTLNEATWQAVSPKLSVQYNTGGNSRVYASYARGFRPSVLDDLCRSGRVRGGFKVANPELGPEYLDNFEIGGDLGLKDKVLFSASLYYSIGHDFIYYVNSGDSIDMGFGNRPIYVPENIAGVQIYGAEAEVSWNIAEGVRLVANYAYAHSTISEYDPATSANPVDITGNFLIEVPAHMAAIQASWYNRIVNVSLAGKFTGKRWVNDLNQYDEVVGAAQYPAYFTLDGQVWKDFRHFHLSLDIQNILDTEYYDSKGAVCPGRFITLTAGYRF